MKLLDNRVQHIDVNFNIDMRTFSNFKMDQLTLHHGDGDREETEKIVLSEQLVSDNDSLFIISRTIHDFLQTYDCSTANGLKVFNPGLYIIDRQSPEDDATEPHCISLCWNRPELLITLVQKAPQLSSLNLTGYEELTDLALEYIAGQAGHSPGLKLLTDITLPKKCFVTCDGIRALLENLIHLEVIENQGKMGAMVSDKHLKVPLGQQHFKLKQFCQTESITSGGIDEDNQEEEISMPRKVA